jgi:beta-glucanase (GH16 family)
MTRHITLNHVRTGISKKIFLARVVGGCAACIAFLFAGEMKAANILTNPGFDTDSFTGWTTYGPNNHLGFGPVHDGNYSLKVYQAFNGQTNYTGVYQDKVASPGAAYSADGWAYNSSGDLLTNQNIAWIEVTFRNGSGNILALYRSSIITTNAIITGIFPKNTWVDLAVTNQYDPNSLQVTNTATSLVAPSGTSFVRYQIDFQGDQHNSAGSVYFDDSTLDDGTVAVVPPVTNNWNIVWDDEFNGTSINPNVWTFETGNNGGWGNSELEYYTGRTNNAYVSGGLLHIVARQESMGGFNYTSARMKTLGLYATPTYGRFEWRARTPAGVGMWPALWMMGTNFPSVGWPSCGEIDVVENNGANPFFVQGSLHSNAGGPTAITSFTGGDSITNFHTYLLDWETNSISWLVDGQVYEAQSSQSPFDAPFFFLMNLAVGGQYVGYPTVSQINAGTVFPAEMQVDYVRVYEQTAPLQISVTQSNGNFVLSWPANIVCHLQTQTNSLAGGSWSDISSATDPLVMAPDPNNVSVFFRLVSP